MCARVCVFMKRIPELACETVQETDIYPEVLVPSEDKNYYNSHDKDVYDEDNGNNDDPVDDEYNGLSNDVPYLMIFKKWYS